MMVKRLRALKSDRRVRILEKYTVFGKYDAALIVDCAGSAEATEFALGWRRRPIAPRRPLWLLRSRKSRLVLEAIRKKP